MRDARWSIDTTATYASAAATGGTAAVYRVCSVALAAGALLLLLFVPVPALGVVANPDAIEHRQPDGTVVTIYLKGDEYLHWNEDETGFAIVRSADRRWWYYAREDNGRLVPTLYAAGSVDPESVGLVKPDIAKLRMEPQRSPQAGGVPDVQKAPLTGTMKNLVVLVDFTDLTISNTRQEFDDLFNQIGYTSDGATGSVRDFYDEVTYNQLNVMSTVVEPVTVGHGYAYYGANDIYGYDIRPREMVSEALAALEARGFDFSTMDSDGDGWVDGLTIIHAGGGEEYSGNDPDYIWSHAWALSSTVIYDGVRMRQYHTEPARRGWDSAPSSWGITRIGVICHETGHFIGLPDLYDYGYDSQGAGRFCLMAGGSWNGDGGATPAHPSGWCKVDRGWIVPTVVTGDGVHTLNQIETVQQIYKLQGSFPSNEYFLVENRQGVGFDAALPGTNRGILIWHVDESQPNNNDQTHYLVDLEEASGTQHLELNQSSGNDADYFRFGNATDFSGSTTPDNTSYAGDPLGIDISNVGVTGSLMTFVVNGLSLTLISPNGGETLPVGIVHEISWTINGDTPDSVSIFLSIDSGANYDYTVATGLIGVTSYDWTVPELPVATARIRVVAYIDDTITGIDSSEGDFTIKGYYRYVSPSGGNVYPYSLPEWAALHIQDAIDAAVSGDSILVRGATYNEQVMVDVPVYLMGGWNSDFTVRDPGVYTTTIHHHLFSGSAISFMSNDPDFCGMEGFTVTGGEGTAALMPVIGTFGGGVFSLNSSPLIKDNVFTDCGSTGELDFSAGGAISCKGGSVTIENNVITGCEAQSGGGIYLYQATAVIRGNRVTGSSPHAYFNGAKYGGGIYALHSTVTLEGNTIENNDGYTNGGGVALRFSAATANGDSIRANDCNGSGGGIFSEYSSLEVDHAVVIENTTAVAGGGIYHRVENLDVANSIVASNESALFGGGVYADSVWGGISNNTIDRNSAAYTGGNVFIGTAVSLEMKNNLITYGLKYGFQANTLTGITCQYNNCYGNFPDEVFGVTPDTTNTSRNPMYADTTGFDYHLLVHSGGIDTGDPAGEDDPDGSRADQGAFGGPGAVMAAPEYVQNLTASAVNDTTIRLSWTAVLPGGLGYYAIYADTVDNFLPSDSVFIGTAGPSEDTFDHHPPAGCRYYRVSAVNLSGYGGGYSNQAGDCVAGPDTVPPSVVVVSPGGGETFAPTDTIAIRWVATDNETVDSVSIFYSENGGTSYTLLAGGEPNDSLYQWIEPSLESDSCLVRIVAYDPSLLTGEDTSDSLFTIKTVTDVEGGTPRYTYELQQNYPNPFNPTTSISFSIGSTTHVSLKIYDVAGRLVRVLFDEGREAGRYSEIWNGLDARGNAAASGVYFYRLETREFVETRKMVLLR